jgi:hypothetical protein
MKSTVAIVLAGLLAAPALAATKTYQVTGPVVEVRDDAVVIEKGKEKWEIARDAGTKVQGDLKKGSKVTVEYRMTATRVEVKDAAKGGKAAGDAKAKPAEKGAPAR